MNEKILTYLTIFALLVPMAATAVTVGPDPNPKGFTVNFVVSTPTSTSFTVQTNTAQLNFSANPNTANVQPQGGNPWGNITNNGNVNLNFTVMLDSLPTNITLRMGSSNTDLMTVGTTAASPTGWKNVPSTGSNKVNIVANATYGTATGTSKTITINGVQS